MRTQLLTHFLLFVTINIAFTLQNFAQEKFDVTKMKGVKLELLSEFSTIKANQQFTMAISIKHSDGFHTYWRNPGLVGFPLQIKWELPPNFTAGDIQWQVPERAKMLNYNCHAYTSDTVLLINIQAPAEIPQEFIILAEITGMSCSEKTCCSIGFAKISANLKSSTQEIRDESATKTIDNARAMLPKAIEGYTFKATKLDTEMVEVVIEGDIQESEFYFYPYENIYDTDQPQEIIISKNKLTIRFKLHKYAPKELKKIEGLVHSKKNWGSSSGQYLPVTSQLP